MCRVVAREDVDILNVKDGTSSCSSFADIVTAMTSTSFTKWKSAGAKERNTRGTDPAMPLPVFLLQLKFVMGGVLLYSSSMHKLLDMNGQGLLLDFLAQACNCQQHKDEDVIAGNLDGTMIIPLLANIETPLQHENFRCPPRLGVEIPAAEVPQRAP